MRAQRHPAAAGNRRRGGSVQAEARGRSVQAEARGRSGPDEPRRRGALGTIDYSLKRRALLREYHAGRVDTYDVCDASPYLLSAARFHGEATEQRCPVCRRENLIHVHYVYGDELKQSAGQARSRAELALLAGTARQVQVYVVEVCRGCRWNHLVQQFPLGQSLLGDASADPQPEAAE